MLYNLLRKNAILDIDSKDFRASELKQHKEKGSWIAYIFSLNCGQNCLSTEKVKTEVAIMFPSETVLCNSHFSFLFHANKLLVVLQSQKTSSQPHEAKIVL